MIQETFSHHPREPRVRRLLKGQMRSMRLPTFEIVIRNISTRGLCAMCRDLPPLEGEVVMIQLPDGRQTGATVQWVMDQVFGVTFDEPINLDSLLTILQRLRDLAERNAQWEVKSKHRVVAEPRLDLARIRRL
ncbi:MAG: hypothetical protein RIQ75_1941 [Pseudomonadota bacterium]